MKWLVPTADARRIMAPRLRPDVRVTLRKLHGQLPPRGTIRLGGWPSVHIPYRVDDSTETITRLGAKLPSLLLVVREYQTSFTITVHAVVIRLNRFVTPWEVPTVIAEHLFRKSVSEDHFVRTLSAPVRVALAWLTINHDANTLENVFAQEESP